MEQLNFTYYPHRDPNMAPMPFGLFADSKISDGAKMLYLHLVFQAQRLAFRELVVSRRTLAQAHGCSEREITRRIGALKAKHWIAIQKRYKVDQFNKAHQDVNGYAIFADLNDYEFWKANNTPVVFFTDEGQVRPPSKTHEGHQSPASPKTPFTRILNHEGQGCPGELKSPDNLSSLSANASKEDKFTGTASPQTASQLPVVPLNATEAQMLKTLQREGVTVARTVEEHKVECALKAKGLVEQISDTRGIKLPDSAPSPAPDKPLPAPELNLPKLGRFQVSGIQHFADGDELGFSGPDFDMLDQALVYVAHERAAHKDSEYLIRDTVRDEWVQHRITDPTPPPEQQVFAALEVQLKHVAGQDESIPDKVAPPPAPAALPEVPEGYERVTVYSNNLIHWRKVGNKSPLCCHSYRYVHAYLAEEPEYCTMCPGCLEKHAAAPQAKAGRTHDALFKAVAEQILGYAAENGVKYTGRKCTLINQLKGPIMRVMGLKPVSEDYQKGVEAIPRYKRYFKAKHPNLDYPTHDSFEQYFGEWWKAEGERAALPAGDFTERFVNETMLVKREGGVLMTRSRTDPFWHEAVRSEIESWSK